MSVTRTGVLDDFVYYSQKRFVGDVNTAAQTLGAITNLPAAGTAWVLHLWIECATENALTLAYYVAGRARSSTTTSTSTRYNVSTNATLLPTPTVTLDNTANTITINEAASGTADGNVACVIRVELRTVDEQSPPTDLYIA